jgi:putative N-acetyltransferase (TIGR04045 family)
LDLRFWICDFGSLEALLTEYLGDLSAAIACFNRYPVEHGNEESLPASDIYQPSNVYPTPNPFLLILMSYHFKLATTPKEIAAYFALRHAIFTEEQSVFQGSDIDELDAIAYPIVAIVPETDQIVGVVRIYETSPGIWYGGRLGTHSHYRRGWQIGKGLIYKAVTTANTWGCHQFFATVQLQNVRFFQRLHWQSLQELTLCDRPHHLMEAELAFYPPGNEPRPVLPIWQPEAQAC